MDKRTFIKNASLLGLGSITALPALAHLAGTDPQPEPNAAPDDYWQSVRNTYNLTPDYINLENGYYCIQPRHILDAYKRHIDEVNLQGAYYMRTVQFDNKKKGAERLAAIVGCTADEVIITRNTAELRILVVSDFRPIFIT